MFRRFAVVGIALAIAATLSSCTIGGLTVIEGSGNKVTQTKTVSGFNNIQLSGIGKLIVKQTGSESFSMEGDDNILSKIKVEVSGSTLNIAMEEGTSANPKTPLVYNITVKNIKTVGLSGAGSIEANDINTTTLDATISGAGNGTINNLTADTLKITLSGAGDFTVSGTVTTQNVTISGAGSYNAGSLESQGATVTTSGAGSATVRVRDNLNANVSGVGNISYYGNPNVQQTKSGVGSITKIGDK
ncbi:MAG: head GIN domain-containing protein [Chloroflexota bacterium]